MEPHAAPLDIIALASARSLGAAPVSASLARPELGERAETWVPKSAGIIGGRKVRLNEYGDITLFRCRPGAPTVSVALMRQRIFYRST